MEKEDKSQLNLAEMTKFPDKSEEFKINVLTIKHEGIITLLATGMSKTDVAEAMDVSIQTVSNVSKSELGSRRLAEKVQEYHQAIANKHIEISSAASEVWLDNEKKAAHKIATIMESGSDANSLKASIIILDRAQDYRSKVNPEIRPEKALSNATEEAFNEFQDEEKERVIN